MTGWRQYVQSERIDKTVETEEMRRMLEREQVASAMRRNRFVGELRSLLGTQERMASTPMARVGVIWMIAFGSDRCLERLWNDRTNFPYTC
jgi:hypothetical protein